MKLIVGKKYLVTTDTWFVAPDGRRYEAVFGTLRGLVGAEKVLGAATNRYSTGWYASIGEMLIEGGRIHYCILTDSVVAAPETGEPPLIYEADEAFGNA